MQNICCTPFDEGISLPLSFDAKESGERKQSPVKNFYASIVRCAKKCRLVARKNSLLKHMHFSSRSAREDAARNFSMRHAALDDKKGMFLVKLSHGDGRTVRRGCAVGLSPAAAGRRHQCAVLSFVLSLHEQRKDIVGSKESGREILHCRTMGAHTSGGPFVSGFLYICAVSHSLWPLMRRARFMMYDSK